jgi:hypothetical protein
VPAYVTPVFDNCRPADVASEIVGTKIRGEFLPRFFEDFGEIWSKRRKDFIEAIPDFYIAVLESLLNGSMGPVRELRDHLAVQSDASTKFDSRLRA